MDTKITNENRDILTTAPFIALPDDNLVEQQKDIEFFECQKCGEHNLIVGKTKKRRVTKVRHVRVNSVTWGSLKRFASINNVSLDYALLMLLFNAKTPNINYVVNARQLVNKP